MDNVRVLLKAVIMDGNKFLTLRRPADSHSRANCWDFPGGNLEFGESAGECLEREIKEETSLKVKDIRPIHVITALDPKKNIFWVEIGYCAKYSGGKVVLSSEHSEYKWVTRDEFLKLESADYLMEFARRV
jgi:mutator protein MutT